MLRPSLLAAGLALAILSPAEAVQAPANNATHSLSCPSAVKQYNTYFYQARQLVSQHGYLLPLLNPSLVSRDGSPPIVGPMQSVTLILGLMKTLAPFNPPVAEHMNKRISIIDDLDASCNDLALKMR